MGLLDITRGLTSFAAISWIIWGLCWVLVSYAVYAYCREVWRNTSVLAVKWWGRLKVCGILLGLSIIIGVQGRNMLQSWVQYCVRGLGIWLYSVMENQSGIDLDLKVIFLGIGLLLQSILFMAWLINGVRTRISRDDLQKSSNSTVIINPNAPILNAATIEDLAKAVAAILCPTPKLDTPSMNEISEILAVLKTLQSDIQKLPQVATITSSLLSLTDIIQEEGVNTREVMRAAKDMVEGHNMELEQVDWKPPVITMISQEDGETPIIAVARENTDAVGKRIQGGKQGLAQSRPGTTGPKIPAGFTPMEPQSPGMQPYTQADMAEFIGKTQVEIIQLLTQRERERKDKLKAPAYLTEEEKEVGKKSLATLDRNWRLNAGNNIGATHYIEIGTLNDNQASLPRYLIKQLIQQRRDAGFIERMKGEGKVLRECNKCRRMYIQGSTHNCFVASGWTTATKRNGVPAKKELLVTQSGGKAIHIRPQIGVDTQRLQENFEKLARYKLVLDDKTTLSTNPNVSPTDTVPITGVAEGSNINNEMQVDMAEPSVIVDLPPDAAVPAVSIVQEIEIDGQNFRLIPC